MISCVSSKNTVAVGDLEYALQLSLAEEKTRVESSENSVIEEMEDQFPTLESPVVSKGKGRAS